MICPNCKTENPDEGQFCSKCGNALGQAAQNIPAPAPKKNYMNGYLSAGVLLAMAASTGIIKTIFKSDDAVGFFVLVALLLLVIGIVKILKDWSKDRKNR